eukprot:1661257-Prymnesium_polylepis.1
MASARRRAPMLFALEAPPDTAARRTEAFEAATRAWVAQRSDLRRKERFARAGRAAVGAAVFAASGGCLVAPVVASLGVAEAAMHRSDE